MDTGDWEQTGGALDSYGGERVDSGGRADTYTVRFDDADRHASEAVVSAVAAATGRDPLSLPPLHDVVDPDALSGLFGARTGGATLFHGSVTFQYADSVVTVDGRGTVEVYPPGDGRPPSR